MRTTSKAELRRQIAREGKRWGVVPVANDHGVCVAQKVLTFRGSHRGLGGTSRRAWPICTIDYQNGFYGFLRTRRRRDEFDLSRRMLERHEARKRAREKYLEEMAEAMGVDLARMNRRQIFLMR